MEWITPKTDWKGYADKDGNYQGDYFNVEDYNRIKNNIKYLRDFAITLYKDFTIGDMGQDKEYTDYPYADEINLLEENLDIIVANTLQKDYGARQYFTDNGEFIDFMELNRIEGVMLDLYNHLCSQRDGRRMLIFMLGRREVL